MSPGIGTLCYNHFMKYDDADWHESDAGDPTSAAVHIALLFVWLVNHNYLRKEWLTELDISPPLSKKKTPTEYLYEYMDGKLIDDVLTIEGKVICDKYYDQYMADFAEQNIKGVRYFNRGDNPYSGKDSWKNVKALDRYFANKF
jgi:hypothetical protein